MLSKILYSAAVQMVLAEANPPSWDTNKVKILSGGSGDQAVVDAIAGQQVGERGQWSNARYAILVKPGYHDVDINVGFYTTVHGLGATPMLTELKGIHVDQYDNMSLDNFWRSAENFHAKRSIRWSVSQASPLRRAHIEGNLYLSQNGYSSGGYLGDVSVSGQIINGSQ
jgi:hypothetical protein